MNRFVTLGLAAVAVVITAFIGYRLLGSSVGGPGATPTPSPRPSLAEPTSQPSIPVTGAGEAPVGSYYLWNGGQYGQVNIGVTIPGSGWWGTPQEGAIAWENNVDPPNGAGMIVFSNGAGPELEYYVYGDPCHWRSTKPNSPATTVDEVVTALRNQSLRDASEPTDVTLGAGTVENASARGKAITLHVPDGADLSQCDSGYFGSFATWSTSLTPDRYHQGPGQIDEMWVLDVGGKVVVLDIAYFPQTPASVVEELRGILASTVFFNNN